MKKVLSSAVRSILHTIATDFPSLFGIDNESINTTQAWPGMLNAFKSGANTGTTARTGADRRFYHLPDEMVYIVLLTPQFSALLVIPAPSSTMTPSDVYLAVLAMGYEQLPAVPTGTVLNASLLSHRRWPTWQAGMGAPSGVRLSAVTDDFLRSLDDSRHPVSLRWTTSGIGLFIGMMGLKTV